MKNKPYSPKEYEALFDSLCNTGIAENLDWSRVEANYFESNTGLTRQTLCIEFDKIRYERILRFYERSGDLIRMIVIRPSDAPVTFKGYSLADKYFNCSLVEKYSLRFERIPNVTVQNNNIFYCREAHLIGTMTPDTLPTDINVMRFDLLEQEGGGYTEVTSALRSIRRYFNLKKP